MSKRRPTIAEQGYCEFLTDTLESALSAAKSTLSGLQSMHTCDSCLRLFDESDPRCYVEKKSASTLVGSEIEITMGWCPGCNIESDPDLAQAALEKAIAMNGQPKKKAETIA